MIVYYFGNHYTEQPFAGTVNGSTTGVIYSGGSALYNSGWILATYPPVKHVLVSEEILQISDKTKLQEYNYYSGSSYSDYSHVTSVPEVDANIMFVVGVLVVALVCKFKRNTRA